MHVTGATAPCSWGVWYADGGPSGTAWETFLDQAAEAGYKALEMGPDGYLPTDVGQLDEELAKRGLEICAGTACYPFAQESLEALKPRIDALCGRLNALEAPWLVVMDGSDVGRHSEKKADMPPEAMGQCLERIGQMDRYVREEYGITAVFHPHVTTMVETTAEVERLLEATGMALCFDTGHHVYVNGGTKPGDTSVLEFMEKHAKYIAYLHFKNMDGALREKVAREHIDANTAFNTGVMCDLADGVIDFVALKKLLDKMGFDGIGVIEQDVPSYTTQQAFDAARRNLDYLKAIGMVGNS